MHIMFLFQKSETLGFNNSRSMFILFSLSDPIVLKSSQTSQHTASNPHWLLSLRRGNHLRLHVLRHQRRNLPFQSFLETVKHGGSPAHYDILTKFPPDVHVAEENTILSLVVNARYFLPD